MPNHSPFVLPVSGAVDSVSCRALKFFFPLAVFTGLAHRRHCDDDPDLSGQSEHVEWILAVLGPHWYAQ